MNHEPSLVTDPSLKHVLHDLIRREPLFHREEFGRARGDFENMIVPDFWEIGASGRLYSREFILAELEKRYGGPERYCEVWEASDFYCRSLSSDTYQLTYTLLQDGNRKTRRTTIWRNTGASWKAVFHQGTIVQQ